MKSRKIEEIILSVARIHARESGPQPEEAPILTQRPEFRHIRPRPHRGFRATRVRGNRSGGPCGVARAAADQRG